MSRRGATHITRAVMLCCLILLCVSEAAAQRPKRNALPRVGAILFDDTLGQPKPGCGNHFLYPSKGAAHDIFRSDDDGFNAWMNLDGRNVELKLVKTTLYHRDRFEARAHYEYRYGRARITVSLTQLTDYTVWVPAKIMLRQGRATRTIRAFVTPQCD